MKDEIRPQAPVHTSRTMRSALVMARHLDHLGTPPTQSGDWALVADRAVGGNWRLLGNSTVGDCVEADDGHTQILVSANAGPALVVPTAEQIVALYSAETGYDPSNPSSDQGTDMTSDCQYMVSTGLLGHKADATGMIDPTNLEHVRWSVQLFGFARLGVNWTQKQMDEFNAGKVIAGDPNGRVLGGHDVPVVRYEGSRYWIVTWGKLCEVDQLFVASAEEAHALIWSDWFGPNGISPSGVGVSQLVADLAALA